MKTIASAAAVATDLLPGQISRRRQWIKKRPWFVAAGVLLLATLSIPLGRIYAEISQLKNQDNYRKTENIIKKLEADKSEHGRWVNQGTIELERIKDTFELYQYRGYWPALQRLISRGIREEAKHQRLLAEYANAQTDEQRRAVLLKFPPIRSQRKMIFIERMEVHYKPNVMDSASVGLRPASAAGGVSYDSMAKRGQAKPAAGSGEARRGYLIRITGQTPLPKNATNPFLRSLLRKWKTLADDEPLLSVVDYDLEKYIEPGEVGQSTRTTRSGRGAPAGRGGRGMAGDRRSMMMEEEMMRAELGRAGRTTATEEEVPTAQMPDPLFPDNPDEDMIKDTWFVIGLVVSIDEPDSAGKKAKR